MTSNHIHLLVTAPSKDGIGRFMDAIQGDFAQKYNIRKGRSGAYWGGRYHATAVESSDHLWQCLEYIDLNMVRAGVVEHPSEWRWCGYAELTGLRKRYRVIDFAAFEKAFGRNPGESDFAPYYSKLIDRHLGAGALSRDPMWTESLAVGRQGYVESVMGKISRRMRLDLMYPTVESGAFFVKEGPSRYS